jgi:diacylglycerol kinase (ATP)
MGETKKSSTRGTVVLVNPNARGGRNRKAVARIAEIVRQTASHTRVIESQSAEHATETLGQLPRGSKVIIAGGDGTVNGVLAAIIKQDHVLGVLPLGSGNDAARALGTYGDNLCEILTRLLNTDSVRRIDVGCVEFNDLSQHFLVALNAGFDASIAERALHGPTWLHGLPRYLFATLRELVAIRHWSVTISLDGNAHFSGDALFASVLNASTFGSGMPAVPHARIDDGALDLLIARQFTRGGALVMLPRLLRGTHLSDSRISTRGLSTMTLTSETPIPLAADGEFLGETQALAIHLRAQSINVIA